jgi:tetratricopeptide (TPR) repeat protein
MTTDKKICENQIVVFTGKFAALARKEAEQLVLNTGGQIADQVTSETTLLVVGDEGFLNQINKSKNLQKAEELADKTNSIKIISESAFLEMFELESRYQLENKYYPLKEILKIYQKIRPEQVRLLQKWDLLQPVTRTNSDQYFEFKDLLLFRKISHFLESGKTIRGIARGLYLEQFPSNQLKIEFEEERPRGQILQFVPSASTQPEPELTAVDWYDIGNQYDTDSTTFPEAIDAYTKALELEPTFTSAAVNLGNLYFTKREFGQAEKFYLQAYQQTPNNQKILFNLGNLYDEIGEYSKSIKFFKKALEIDPFYADGHFNIALVYEKLGLIVKAKSHWQMYLKIDPTGEAAKVAREHLK